jgi:hypothetical protein
MGDVKNNPQNKMSTQNKIFSVTYSFSNETNTLTADQILGGGNAFEHQEPHRMTDFGRNISRCAVGQSICLHHAWGQRTTYTRTA